MLWTIISNGEVFYQLPQRHCPVRSSNPYDYVNGGYCLQGASLFGGQNHVVYNCDISSHRTGGHLGTPRV